MDVETISTNTVHDRDRRSFWADAVCDTYAELDCSGMPTSFQGSMTFSTQPDIQMSLVQADAQTCSRTLSHISRSHAPEDYIFVDFLSVGAGVIRQDGREAYLRPGDFALCDTTRPYSLTFTDRFELLIVKLPRRFAERHSLISELLAARTISTDYGFANLVACFVRHSWRQLQELPSVSAPKLADGIASLVAGAVEPLLPGVHRDETSYATLLRYRILDFIDRNLGDPTLCSAGIAAAHRLSGRALRRLVEDQPAGLGRIIWERRLERCKRDLLTPALAGLTVSEIGFRWGFSDSAHFSRAFKRAYGIAPRDYRRTAAPCRPEG